MKKNLFGQVPGYDGGSGTWSGSLYEEGYFKTIIILIFFIDPLISEDFRFPVRILPDILQLQRNWNEITLLKFSKMTKTK